MPARAIAYDESAGSALVMIAIGVFRVVVNGESAMPNLPPSGTPDLLQGAGVLLIIRAFASGSVALTGTVTVLPVADRLRGYVTVKGNVWVEGQVGFVPGMKLSDAIRLAGGPKPDVYLDRILVSRTNDDSTRVQLRSAFADSTGRISDDLLLQDQDEVRVFSRATFLTAAYVTIVGGVRNPGRVPYREGMTLRDLVLPELDVVVRRALDQPKVLLDRIIREPSPDTSFVIASRSGRPRASASLRAMPR